MTTAYVVISGVDGPPSYPEPTVIAGFVVLADNGSVLLSAPPGALGTFAADDTAAQVQEAVAAAVRAAAGDPGLDVIFLSG